jgi:hypothetical protein
MFSDEYGIRPWLWWMPFICFVAGVALVLVYK